MLDAIGAAIGTLSNQVAGVRVEDMNKINEMNFRHQAVETQFLNSTAKASDEGATPMTARRALSIIPRYTGSWKEYDSWEVSDVTILERRHGLPRVARLLREADW